MLQCATGATPTASIFVLPPYIFSSFHAYARRNTFLSSPKQSHGGIIYLCRRSLLILSKSSPDPIESIPVSSLQPDDTENIVKQELQNDFYLETMACDEDFEIEVLKVGGKKNRRMIRAMVRIEADLNTVWRVLTDYEGLSTFIPGLAVCQLLEKSEKFVRLYQVGEQYLALGLKFKAKGVLECYEGDFEETPIALRRNIEFRMVEGDFKTFEGRWSIEQVVDEACEDGDILKEKEYRTTLSYVVELEPKLWLPVHLLEGRVCREVKTNLLCIRNEAQRIQNLEIQVLTPRETDPVLTDSSEMAAE